MGLRAHSRLGYTLPDREYKYGMYFMSGHKMYSFTYRSRIYDDDIQFLFIHQAYIYKVLVQLQHLLHWPSFCLFKEKKQVRL